jgi:hypothetical protein
MEYGIWNNDGVIARPRLLARLPLASLAAAYKRKAFGGSVARQSIKNSTTIQYSILNIP